MNCSLIPLLHSAYIQQDKTGNYLKRDIELSFNEDKVGFEVTNVRSGVENTLGFSLDPLSSQKLAHTILSYYGDNDYIGYKNLLKKQKEKEYLASLSPAFYSVWLVRFGDDKEKKWYHWQGGDRPLDTRFLGSDYVAIKQYFPYANYK